MVFAYVSPALRHSTTALLVTLLFHLTPSMQGSSAVIAIAPQKPAESPVTISVTANYLAAEIRIESDDDDWSLKLAGLDEAKKLLVSQATKEGFNVKIDQSLVFHQRYNKFSFSSSSGGTHDTFSDTLLLAPIGEKTNLVSIVKQFRTIISGIKPASKKVTVTLGGLFLAVDDPESFRGELLKKTHAHVETTRRALGDKIAFSVSGLDEPVHVRQSGERNIELYLPFRVNYSNRGSGD